MSEPQKKRFAEEKHGPWDREGLLASPLLKSMSVFSPGKERRKEKSEEEFTFSSYLVLAPPSSLPR